jgi:hypothetical protein
VFGQLTEKKAIKIKPQDKHLGNEMTILLLILTAITDFDIFSIHVNVWTKSA